MFSTEPITQKKTIRLPDRLFLFSQNLERDGIAGAFTDASAAFDAFSFVDNGKTVFHSDCIDGA